MHTDYTVPGPLADPGRHRDALAALPSDLPGLAAAVQSLLIHQDLTGRYGVARTEGHFEAANLRPVAHLLDRLVADGRPLTEPREPADRLGSTCRDFTLLTAAALKTHGVPARARCGFGRYFETGWYIDHWVTEYRGADGRWRLADAQMDAGLRKDLALDFDCADIPRDRFVVAGDAWLGFRRGEIDPDRCGLTGDGQAGWWWIAGNLIRDAAALADMELLPWDVWGGMPEDDPFSEDTAAWLDELAAVTADPATAADVRERYASDHRLRVPAKVYNFLRKREESVLG